ncbi:acetylcholinesterase-1 [Trichonephila inaurata madagascariensis]|uniref:Acetylcholinesterase-1 n=1 Tax=Trichonephila inaurata madagascariensis TaxID=2747483 RepID=A0A8X6YAJ4_9ARAC|nr:acetylcholinesterase-1 [Trichonephila inaurata madagascariensis]
MESGAPTFWNAETLKSTNLAFAQQLAKIVNCANDTFTIQNNPKLVVNCLKKVDPIVLSRADFQLINYTTNDFMPIYGDEIVPENPKIAISKKNFQCTDLLIGNNKDEGSFQITTENPQLFGFFGEKDPQINKTMGADIIREQGENVYFYIWRHRPSTTVWASWMGAAHYTEVQFVFGQPLQNPSRYEASEIQLSEEMIKIWSSFVKTGNPGISWSTFSPEKPNLKYIGPKLSTEEDDSGFHRENCNFFRPYFGF